MVSLLFPIQFMHVFIFFACQKCYTLNITISNVIWYLFIWRIWFFYSSICFRILFLFHVASFLMETIKIYIFLFWECRWLSPFLRILLSCTYFFILRHSLCKLLSPFLRSYLCLVRSLSIKWNPVNVYSHELSFMFSSTREDCVIPSLINRIRNLPLRAFLLFLHPF